VVSRAPNSIPGPGMERRPGFVGGAVATIRGRAYPCGGGKKQKLEDPLPVAATDCVFTQQPQEGRAMFHGGLAVLKSGLASKSTVITMRLSRTKTSATKTDKTSRSAGRLCLWGARSKRYVGSNEKHMTEFDYGYVLTVTNAGLAMGTTLVLFEEVFAFRDRRARWLYTGHDGAAPKRLSVVCEAGTSEGKTIHESPDAALAVLPNSPGHRAHAPLWILKRT